MKWFAFIRKCRLKLPFWGLLLGVFLLAISARSESAPANLRFDVFLGYDGLVPEATWFPVQCEIKNDGPPFTGIIEVAPGNANVGQVRRMIVELPTGTLKRLSIPMFCSSSYPSWDVRLLDE